MRPWTWGLPARARSRRRGHRRPGSRPPAGRSGALDAEPIHQGQRFLVSAERASSMVVPRLLRPPVRLSALTPISCAAPESNCSCPTGTPIVSACRPISAPTRSIAWPAPRRRRCCRPRRSPRGGRRFGSVVRPRCRRPGRRRPSTCRRDRAPFPCAAFDRPVIRAIGWVRVAQLWLICSTTAVALSTAATMMRKPLMAIILRLQLTSGIPSLVIPAGYLGPGERPELAGPPAVVPGEARQRQVPVAGRFE